MEPVETPVRRGRRRLNGEDYDFLWEDAPRTPARQLRWLESVEEFCNDVLPDLQDTYRRVLRTAGFQAIGLPNVFPGFTEAAVEHGAFVPHTGRVPRGFSVEVGQDATVSAVARVDEEGEVDDDGGVDEDEEMEELQPGPVASGSGTRAAQREEPVEHGGGSDVRPMAGGSPRGGQAGGQRRGQTAGSPRGRQLGSSRGAQGGSPRATMAVVGGPSGTTDTRAAGDGEAAAAPSGGDAQASTSGRRGAEDGAEQ